MSYGPYSTREEYLAGRQRARLWRQESATTAYTGPFPIRSHRTLEQVDRDDGRQP